MKKKSNFMTQFSHVFFCAGARNHPLLSFFEGTSITFEYDERIASFMALGLSKNSDQPVVICTTSGTAVANCMGAMLEAYYSELPLILITGDRPKKLHQTGAPQTIVHQTLTQTAVRTFIETTPDELKIINFGDFKKSDYPLHLNVLIDDTSQLDQTLTLHQDDESFFNKLSKFKSPLILFSHSSTSMRDLILKVIKTNKNLPFYAESLSGGRDLSWWQSEKDLLELFHQNAFDAVLRIGHTPLSKIWRELEKKYVPAFHLDSRSLSALSYGDVLAISPDQLIHHDRFFEVIKNFKPHFPEKINDLKKQSPLKQLISKYPQSEISYFAEIQNKLPADSVVYLGNSLIVRHFELTQQAPLKVFGNRGVNGIDGQLSTAIGLAKSFDENVYCLLGDLTTWYDLSALNRLPPNLFLIVINNQGGQIFDLLGLDTRIVLSHQRTLEKVSQAFGLSYGQSLEQWGQVQVLEVMIDHEQTQKFYQEWKK